MSEMAVVTARDIDIVTAEINTIKVQTSRMIVANAIEIGRRLVEAKSMVDHGEWGKYLQERVDYSQSTANNLMRLYEEYGDNQESLFASFSNSQAFGNLTYTKALRLLAIPAEERAAFAEENDVENLSTRELDKLIKERDEAKNAQAAAEKAADVSAAAAKGAEEQVKQLQEEVRAAKDAETAIQKQIDALKVELEQAKKAEQTAKDKVKKLKENPSVPDAVMEKMRQEAEAKAAEKASAEMQEKVKAAEQQASTATKAKETAEKALREAEGKLAAAQKTASLSNPDAAVFKAIFEQVQQDFNRLHGALLKVQAADPTVGAKLQAATVALLDKLRADISK